jgi:hypothetical protein
VGSVYVSYYPDLAVPGAAEDVRSFAEHGVESGVRRLVLLSERGGGPARSGRSCTPVFQPELQREILPEPILAEARAIPVDGVAEPFVDAEDLADVAVAALTEEGHAGQLCEVTAPRLLTFAKAVGEISRVSGREIRYVPISVEQFASAVEAFVLPPEFVGLLTYLFT